MPESQPKLTFLGAAGTVTGSCYSMEFAGRRFLVDCGMFQGNKTLRELNYGAFPFDPADIDFVLLTHAHTDHSGMIPKLYKNGFRGVVYCTPPTADLLSFMLPDSGHIQESEVRWLNQRNRRRGRPEVQPIYTRDDAVACMRLVQAVDYGEWLQPAEGVRVRYWNAGHILGSASIELHLGRPGEDPLKLVFSGDIGPQEKSFHQEPEAPSDIDYLLVEGTYGARVREDVSIEARRAQLRQLLLDGLKRGGNILIPAFAVERTQELLHDIALMVQQNQLPNIPVFLDSPLAIQATETFARHAASLEDMHKGEDSFEGPRFRFVETVEESKALARVTAGAVIIAASGMCDAGRIRFHLQNNLWRPEATVVFVGYQAPGTIGSLLQQGKKLIRIHGEEVAIRARIETIDAYSAHADQTELVQWVQARRPVRGGIFLTHGEPGALTTLTEALIASGCPEELLHQPRLDDAVRLHPMGPEPVDDHKVRARPEEIARTDWHNDYAGFLAGLSSDLRALPDGVSRRTLLNRLQAVVDEAVSRKGGSA